jgi:hypothetical protein
MSRSEDLQSIFGKFNPFEGSFRDFELGTLNVEPLNLGF